MSLRQMTSLAAVLLVLPVISRGGDAKTDKEKLQGTWKLVSLEADGEQGPAHIVAKLNLSSKTTR